VVIWQRYKQLGTFSTGIYSNALSVMLFGEMYDEIHMILSPQEEDGIPPSFSFTNFGGLKNHVTDLDV
jgi:hypothetical protein